MSGGSRQTVATHILGLVLNEMIKWEDDSLFCGTRWSHSDTAGNRKPISVTRPVAHVMPHVWPVVLPCFSCPLSICMKAQVSQSLEQVGTVQYGFAVLLCLVISENLSMWDKYL